MSVERNKAIARRVFEDAFAGGDLAVLDETLADDTRDRQHPDEPSFRVHLKAVVTAMREAFPDLRWEINQMVGEGEWVALHSFMIGTHNGNLGPPLSPRVIAPTGRPVRVAHLHMIRFGPESELLHVMDTLGMLLQLGVFPGAPAPTGAPDQGGDPRP
ncbi:MAG: ester cyclase [Candidatus Dormiibacterota bacterium]